MNEELHTYLEEKFSEIGVIVNNALTSVEARIDERIDGVDSPRWPPQIPPAVAGSNSPS